MLESDESNPGFNFWNEDDDGDETCRRPNNRQLDAALDADPVKPDAATPAFGRGATL